MQEAAHRATPDLKPAEGRLGVLIPGMGAVTTTFIAGIEAVKRNVAKPIGSLTQLSTIRLGKRTDNRTPKINDFLPLAKIEDLVFAGWDVFDDNCFDAAVHAGVLQRPLLDQLREPLEKIKPMPAVFDTSFVKRLNGPNLQPKGSKMDYAQAVMEDIREFQKTSGVVS
jgi:myo-inositol-1-phosphate synthase